MWWLQHYNAQAAHSLHLEGKAGKEIAGPKPFAAAFLERFGEDCGAAPLSGGAVSALKRR